MNRRAHTLWEMLLVLAVIGMMATLAVPVVPAWRAASRGLSPTARVAREIDDLLTRARLDALQRGETVQVVFDSSTGHYWIIATSRGIARDVGEGTIDLSPDVVLAAPDARLGIRYAPDGTSSGARIVVRDATGTARVSVDPWSGIAHAD